MRYTVVIYLFLIAAVLAIGGPAAQANTSCNPKFEKCGW